MFYLLFILYYIQFSYANNMKIWNIYQTYNKRYGGYTNKSDYIVKGREGNSGRKIHKTNYNEMQYP